MFKISRLVPLAAAFATAGLTALAAPALATVSPTAVPTSCSTAFPPAACVAGYYAAPNASRTADGDHMTGVKTTFVLPTALEAHSGGSAVAVAGVEGCQFKNLPGHKVVLYASWNNGLGVFDIFMGVNPSGSCLAGLTDVSPVKIDSVPAGHTLFLAITQGHHGSVFFTDSDETNDTGAVSTIGPVGFRFNRVGVGTQAGPNLLTTPASNNLVSFTHVQVRDRQPGSGDRWVSINRSHLTRLVIVKTTGTTDGTNAGGVVMTPTPFTGPASFVMLEGQLSV